MPAYTPLASVMPVASMVTGAAVTAALGDQIRDNTVALYEGWWYRAIRTTSQTIGASANTTILFESLTQSATSLAADGGITLASGVVTTRRPGIWLVGGHVEFSAITVGTVLLSLQSTDSPGGYTAQFINDTANNKSGASVSVETEVTSAVNVFSLDIFNTSSFLTRASQLTTALWGVWLGDNP
jgi:hypothetical protein